MQSIDVRICLTEESVKLSSVDTVPEALINRSSRPTDNVYYRADTLELLGTDYFSLEVPH
jgi:hypothetical protein